MALDADAVRANLAEIQEEVHDAARRSGRNLEDVEIVAAVKYVELEDLPALAAAGITTVAENRAQELERKHAAFPDFTWDFIGQLQSRKVRTIAPLVRCIHSVGSESAVGQLAKYLREEDHDDPPQLLVQVNIAEEEGKAGIAPQALEPFLEEANEENVVFDGIMVMPPLAESPEDSRWWFAAARDLAAEHDLPQLSMGTTQDFAVAVEEGATMIRVGTRLYNTPVGRK